MLLHRRKRTPKKQQWGKKAVTQNSQRKNSMVKWNIMMIDIEAESIPTEVGKDHQILQQGNRTYGAKLENSKTKTFVTS